MKINCLFGKRSVSVNIEAIDGKFILSFPYFKELIEEVKNMSGAEWHPDNKTWSVEANKRNMFTLDVLQNRGDILRYDKSIIPYNKDGFYRHQTDMYSFMRTRQRCIIGGEMRTGKTLPTLQLIMDIQNETNTQSVSWLFSTSSALRGIQREINKWGFNKPMHLMTYSALRSTRHLFENMDMPKFLIFDECQKLKTPTSDTTKAAMELTERISKEFKGEEYIIGLSGTPAPKDPTDWWSVCEVICPGYLRESTKHKLTKRIGNCELIDIGPGNKVFKLKKTEKYPEGWITEEVDKLYRRLRGLVSIYFKKDCLDLPDKVYEIVTLKPNKRVLTLAKFITQNETTSIAAINKLMQLSDGFQYEYEYDEKKNVKKRTGAKWLDDTKLRQLELDLNEHEDTGRLVIYAGFEASVNRITTLCEALDWTVMQIDGRGTKIKISHSDNIRLAEGSLNHSDFTESSLLNEMDRSTDTGRIAKLVLVAQADSAGTGLELSATPTIIYYSNTNKGESRMQSEDRAHSMNMDKNRGLTIIDYINLPTDKRIRDSLLSKKKLQAISMGDLENILKEQTHMEEI